jgi:hypothetical protein
LLGIPHRTLQETNNERKNMKPKKTLRTAITATGSFVSLPEAFEGVDDAFKFAPKIELRTARFDDSRHPLKIDHVMSPHTLLLDLEAVDAQAFDASKLIRDCELIKAAAEKHPKELKSILAAFGADVSHDRILEAAKTAEKIGISENQGLKKGGGFLIVLLVVAAVVLSGCKECAHTKGAMRQ